MKQLPTVGANIDSRHRGHNSRLSLLCEKEDRSRNQSEQDEDLADPACDFAQKPEADGRYQQADGRYQQEENQITKGNHVRSALASRSLAV